AEIGVAASGKRAQQIERRGRLPIGQQQAQWTGYARIGGEVGAVNDVATIDRQLDIAPLLDPPGARLGELAAASAHPPHPRGARIGQYDRHLQEYAEEVADVVGAVLGEAFGAIAALEEERLALGDAPERLHQVARLTCKNQRRKGRQLLLDVGERLLVGVIR